MRDSAVLEASVPKGLTINTANPGALSFLDDHFFGERSVAQFNRVNPAVALALSDSSHARPPAVFRADAAATVKYDWLTVSRPAQRASGKRPRD